MNPLVPPSWLCNHLSDPGIIVLDATLSPVGVSLPVNVHTKYLEKHLPGALFFDINQISDHSTTLPHMLPTAEAFSHMMSELGVGDDMQIVIYEQEGVFSAPRAWWMLRTLGAKRVHILDGGLQAWLKAGFPVSSGYTQREPACFRGILDSTAMKDFAQIREMLGGNRQILDARSIGRFSGVATEPRPELSSGHMPGAISIPYTELVEEGRMKTAEKLRELFSDKGVDIQRPITTTCGSGVTAAVIALGLEIAGAQNVSLYDGSWAEYAQRPEAVIEKSI